MNNYQIKIDFKLASTKVFLLCLFLAFGSGKAYSQCNYVTTNNGKETKLSIPCNFPFVKITENRAQDMMNFKAESEKWFSANPTFKNLKLVPNYPLLPAHIDITENDFNKFSDDKKTFINYYAFFYKVIQSSKQ